MASKKDATTQIASGLRRCIGSTTFGIETHEAPVDDFPVQASAKDGLGRMCREHWTAYTRALRKASLARKADVGEPESAAELDAPIEAPRRTRRTKAAPEPEAVAG